MPLEREHVDPLGIDPQDPVLAALFRLHAVTADDDANRSDFQRRRGAAVPILLVRGSRFAQGHVRVDQSGQFQQSLPPTGKKIEPCGSIR